MEEILRADPGGLRTKTRRPEKSKNKHGHTSNGFPHLSSITGACLCTDSCCMGDSGCRCTNGCSGFGHEGCRDAMGSMVWKP